MSNSSGSKSSTTRNLGCGTSAALRARRMAALFLVARAASGAIPAPPRRSDCGNLYTRVIGRYDAIYGYSIAQFDDPGGCRSWIGAVDLDVAVAHVEGGRFFRCHDQVDVEPFRGSNEV